MYTIMLDLDNTLFDIKPLIVAAFKDKRDYFPPTTYNVYNCYPKEVADVLTKIFNSDAMYYTPLLHANYSILVNNLQKQYNVKYITFRSSKKKILQHLKESRIYSQPDQIIISSDPTKMKDILQNHIDFVVDDHPDVIASCLQNQIPHLMISTDETPYNHHLRKDATWAENLNILTTLIEQRRQR